MNYLAHIFLASHSNDAMVGALLDDFVKASNGDQYDYPIALEIALHRKIDVYTDSHPIIQDARQLFENGRRRYAGILLDIFYDHVLAKNWRNYSATPLSDFIQKFYAGLSERQHILPDTLAWAAPRMIEQDWLGSYIDFSGVHIAVNRVSTRLSRNGHLLREGMTDLDKNYVALASGFETFFPDLIRFAKEQRQELISNQPSPDKGVK